MTTSVLFDLFGIRAKEGNYVLFVVVANFICAFLYLAAAYGFFFTKKWTSKMLFIASGILLLTFIALGFYIASGGIYEFKTVLAMTFRTLITIAFGYIAYKFIY